MDGNCTLLLHGALLYHVRVLVADCHMPLARAFGEGVCVRHPLLLDVGKNFLVGFIATAGLGHLDNMSWILLSWILQILVICYLAETLESLAATLK